MKPRVNSHNHSIPIENSNIIHINGKLRTSNLDGLSARLFTETFLRKRFRKFVWRLPDELLVTRNINIEEPAWTI